MAIVYNAGIPKYLSDYLSPVIDTYFIDTIYQRLRKLSSCQGTDQLIGFIECSK